jgi:endonuclease/exonuclease/phosphatase family metal-dependent hydrolase
VTRCVAAAPCALIALIALLALLTGCSDPPPIAGDAADGCRGGPAAVPAHHTLHWRVLADTGQRRTLDAYCVGTGPPVLYAAGESPEPTGDSLAVVAWNMALGAGDLLQLIEDLRSGVHTGGIVLRHFVLLLQEAPRSGAPVPPEHALPRGTRVSSPDPILADIRALAVQSGLHLLYVPSMREGRSGRYDSGTAVLSTLPFRAIAAVEMPPGIRRRVAAVATIDWTMPVQAVSVHLDNFSATQPLGSFGRIRARQARALARALPDSGTTILGGDLNTWARGPAEPAYQVLRRRLPLPVEQQPRPTARRLGIGRRLDYLMGAVPAGWTLTETRLDPRYGSDHHPVLGILHRNGAVLAR